MIEVVQKGSDGIIIPLHDDVQPDVAQRRASDPAASIWVGASAGSGKTKVLADRVIRLLLAGVRPEKILCLTFTRAAAAEMSIRITRQLARWATCDDDALREELDALQSPHAPEPEQMEEARCLFARMLACPGGMRIHTVHAFGQEILRRFPVEAGLSPHFALLEEADAHALRVDAQSDVLQRASSSSDSAEGKALGNLVREMGEERFTDLLKEAARDAPRLNAAMEQAGGLKKLVARLRSLLELEPGETEETIRAQAVKAMPRNQMLWLAHEYLERGTPSFKERGGKMLDWLVLPKEDLPARIGEWMRFFLTGKHEPYAKCANKELLSEEPEFEPVFRREEARLTGILERLDTVRIAEQTEAVLTLALAVAARYDACKAAQGALDYDDLIRRTDDLLRRPGIAPWVLFKLDGGVDHILVDEAQDTSPEQWRIVAALAEEFFAGKGSREGVHRTLFVVGDEKQSIYSFLKADPDEFQRMREHFRTHIVNADRAYGDVALNVSFRSAPAVLKAVDAVFAQEVVRQGVSHDPVKHEAFHRQAAGRVEVWPLVPKAEKNESSWALPLHYESERNPVVELAERIADKIENWVRSGVTIYDRKTKSFRSLVYGDVMILVRKRRPFVEPLVRELKKQRVPVTGADRMMLTEQLAVMDLVALLQFMLLPEDDLNLATVLRGPLMGCSEAPLMELAIGRKGTLWESLKESKVRDREPGGLRNVCDYLEKCLAQADEATPFELLARVLSSPCPADERSGRRAMLKRLGPDALDPLDELLNAAQQFGARHTPSLQAFLQWLLASEAEIKREMDAGAGQVRIVTVHAAKGLEAPVVILPDAASVPKTNDLPKILWHNEHCVPFFVPREPRHTMLRGLREIARRKQLEEYRRLLYVAMTRAADHLYICGWESARQENVEESWHTLALQALKPLHEDFAVDEDSIVRPEAMLADSVSPASFPRSVRVAAQTDHGNDTMTEDELPLWALCDPGSEPKPPRPLTPSRPDEDEPPLIAPHDAKFARGRIIHRLLQGLPDVDVERQEEAAQRYLQNPQLNLNVGQQREIAHEVFALLRHPKFAPLFGENSRAEVPIVGLVEERPVAGQVDRLCVRGEEVWIVDYKTNRPPPANAKDVSSVYLKQMAAYRDVLQKVYPGKTVRTFLLWTYEARMMELPM